MAPLIDVIIPVYNAPVLTKQCIASVITHLGPSVQNVLVQDDASDRETRDMLDQLAFHQLQISHSAVNRGFGASVNEAITRSNADLVLVLNSDTEVGENFIPVLCAAFAADSKLAVLCPALQHSDLSRYIRRPAGYIPSYRLQGYAFMVRRQLFLDIGGFDPEYGRGYYEDTDLGRRLNREDWYIGVHPDARIWHKGGESFGRGKDYRLLVRRNRTIYLSRYPEACQNVLLVSNSNLLDELPEKLLIEINYILRQGGSLHWLTPKPTPKLLSQRMRNYSNCLIILGLMLKGLVRKDKRISAVYISSDVPMLVYGLLIIYARIHKLKLRVWGIQPHS